MYFTLKAILRSLLLPPASALIIGLLGALLLRRWRRLGLTLLIGSVVSLWLLSTPLVADALLQWVERFPALDLSQPTRAQAIVVIGGGGVRRFAPEYQASAPEDILLERLSYTAFVARRSGLPVLVSGASNEAPVMRESLDRDFGVPVRWVEAGSRDTFQNARFSAQILQAEGINRIILVTMSTHMYRAVQEFADAGFEVTPAPSGVFRPRARGVMRIVPTPGSLAASNSAVYEMLGEPMRRLQAALGIRERFDSKAAAAVNKERP